MRSLHFFTLFILLVAAVGAVRSQPAPLKVDGGVMNGRATSLATPDFPAAARAIGANGAVNVEVEVDESGKVVSAKAVSGHPLLRSSAVKAALASTFPPVFISGKPVKVAGTLIFNFSKNGTASAPSTVKQPASKSPALVDSGAKSAVSAADVYAIGLGFGKVSTVGVSPSLDFGLLRRIIPKDWRRELELLSEIEANLKRSEQKENLTDGAAATAVVDTQTASLARNAISLVEDRLVNDSLLRWKFRIGVALMVAKDAVETGTDEARRQAAFAIREIAFVSPAGVEVRLVDELGAFSDLVEKGTWDEFRPELSRLLIAVVEGFAPQTSPK